ncbi:hypothetical protein HYZ99_04400, partial [Candidatus Peregrinibacteria bacterium]|nr:hypothetical protein [Candidatus Peregrinibacteria bacterium]
RDEGKCHVTDVVAIFSYELLAGLEHAQQGRVRLHPLCTISDLTEVAIEQGRIQDSDRDLINAFVKDPEGWRR